jgi:ribonuclease P/MRP protein subunit RPP1
MNDKALQQACMTLDCDIISLDFSTRLPYHFKHKMLASAISRGIRFEICYSAALAGGADARRYLITNATALIRTTRGRGIIISSEARRALGCRAPWDVINLASVWGLKQERAKEAVCEEARKVVVRARMVRQSWRGAVEVKYGGEVPKVSAKEPEENLKGKGKGPKLVVAAKRKAAEDREEVEAPLSKREMKRRAKKARQDAVLQASGTDTPDKENTVTSTPAGVETETATPMAVQNGG